MRKCIGRDSAQDGYHRLESVFKSKLLQIHPIKSCFVLFKKDKMQTAIENDDFTVSKSSGEKWLSDGGLIKSVEATVKSQYGRTLSTIFEMKTVVEDLRMQMIGGIKCGLDIWELALILSQISDQAMDSLNELQYIFMQNLFCVRRSCPKPALCWDTATTMMQVRIEKAKLSLIHHIQSPA
jgi:hypothetical protein